MSQLFISDLDGTLLNPDSRISDFTAQTISRLTDRGALISVATARTPATVDILLRHTRTSIPAIVMTGAALWHRDTRNYTDVHRIDPHTAAIITDTMRRNGIIPFIYTIAPDGIIHTYYNGTHTPTSKEQKFIDQRSHLPLKRMHINEPVPPLATDSPVLIFALGDKKRIYDTAETLRDTAQCSVSNYLDIFNTDIAYIEVFAPGVSKAAAVTRLKESTRAHTLTVFGDNLNDLPMMAVADVAVAVGNALPQVREAADVVIDTNATDAVARYIAENFKE